MDFDPDYSPASLQFADETATTEASPVAATYWLRWLYTRCQRTLESEGSMGSAMDYALDVYKVVEHARIMIADDSYKMGCLQAALFHLVRNKYKRGVDQDFVFDVSEQMEEMAAYEPLTEANLRGLGL